MSNFKRSAMADVYTSLRFFTKRHEIYMGIDESNDDPNIVGYVFYHYPSSRGCFIMIDFKQVDDLCETISVCIDALKDRFNLEEHI